MDKAQKAKIKQMLLQKREDIITKVKHIEKENLGTSQRDASGDLSGYSLHMADVASDNFDREMSLGLAANEREIIYEIDAALLRLKERDFGKCEHCEKDISKKRLMAVPYVRLCISCQEKEEKKLK